MTQTEMAEDRSRGPDSLLTGSWMRSSPYWTVAVLLSVAGVFSAILLSKHFGGSLPGCGPSSVCEALEKSPWGKIPFIQWPVSFLGFAYFFSLLVGWMVLNRELPAAVRWLMRVAGVASLLLISVMISYKKICPYCVGAHAANLAAIFIVEREAWRSARQSLSSGEPVSWELVRNTAGAALAAFIFVSTALGVANAKLQQKVRESAEADRRESTEKILAQSQTSPPTAAPAISIPATGNSADVWGSAGFTGRYRLGPEASPIRIVILTDYQCVDCNKVEPDVEEILASRSDVSLSIKHYPMCAEASPGVPCNRFAKQTLHANACWAARAAEAAGILKGDDGFWKMHRWLFSRSGNFTNAELAAAVRGMGFDPDVFSEVMRGPETLRRVQADCEEGGALGLYFTPMVFINGVEFKGWQVPGALRRTVEEVAAKNPPALKPTADRPALAASKYIQDWQDQPVRVMPPDTRAWTTGDGTSGAGGRRVDVVLFGDYQEPYTAATDLAIRQQLKRWPSVRYTFRHFPIDPKINPTLPPNVRPEALHPMAGRAAQAAEAAGSLGGGEAYWKMHEWLMRNLSSFNDESLRAAARNLGLDPSELFAEMDKPHVAAAIVEDARAAQQLGLTGVPMVFVNAKWVWRTTREGENIVLKVIEEAAGL